MPRVHFDEQLRVLNRELLKMGSLVERALDQAAFVLSTNDVKKALRVIEADSHINRKERDIENLCIKLLLQQQPVARDLRTISSALKMITDMERIGDQAADICTIVAEATEHLPLEQAGHLPDLAEATQHMVSDALEALVKRDVERVGQVILQDNEVDRLFAVVRSELITLIRTHEHLSETALDRLMVAKYFERIGDHAQNIAEWVEYSLTGYYKGEVLG